MILNGTMCFITLHRIGVRGVRRVRRRREDGGGALMEVIQNGVVLCLTGACW